MWEAIRSNKRRSVALILVMFVLLLSLGTIIGMSVEPRYGWSIGALIAAAIWSVQSLLAFTQGDRILLATAGAREIQKADAPRLWNTVEEMTLASQLGAMPKVFIVDSDTPNAFAVGQNPQRSAVAVTSGLLARLNRDELQGVVAHEIAHIKNQDVRYMTLAAVMVGSVVLLADVYLRALYYGGTGRHTRTRSRSGGQGANVMVLVAIAMAILAPLAAQLLYFACSRQREYLADASAARFTRYPAGLASALEKIAGRVGAGSRKETSRVLSPLYIINPLQAHGGVAGLFSTHPDTRKRIAILRAMAGASYLDYERAYRRIESDEPLVGRAALEDAEAVPFREPAAEPETRDEAIRRAREATDLVGRFADLLVIPCVCGIRIKVPPNFKPDSVPCPRCNRTHPVPRAVAGAGMATAATAAITPPAAQPLTYRRTGEGWESFRCPCGCVVQISPTFSADHVRCPRCKRRVDVVGSESGDTAGKSSRP